MFQLLPQSLVDAYEAFLEAGDPRVNNWPLVRSPIPTLVLVGSYVYFVKHLGPRLMKNRPPYNVRGLMIVYNLVMVMVSSYLFWTSGMYGWFGKYSYRCQPIDYTESEDGLGMATMCYFYFLTKFVEFADSVFFVLRKKFTHLSTLHVIHHGLMPFSVWWGMKFVPGGHSTFFGFMNSFIHIVMYLYYGLSAIGPQMYPYLGWKRYLTSLQMVQFVAIFVHSFQLLFRDCDYPQMFFYWIGAHGLLFLVLFINFYRTTYGKKDKDKDKDEDKSSPVFDCSSLQLLDDLTCSPEIDENSNDMIKRPVKRLYGKQM